MEVSSNQTRGKQDYDDDISALLTWRCSSGSSVINTKAMLRSVLWTHS